jgi:hypothetical protein
MSVSLKKQYEYYDFFCTALQKISIVVPSRERSVLLQAWPDGDFSDNTRTRQRVKRIVRFNLNNRIFYNNNE